MSLFNAGLMWIAHDQVERGAENFALKLEGNAHLKANKEFMFRAKSQVHGLRSRIHAHQIVEADLVAALKAENANHPLASIEAVEAAVTDRRAAALLDPEVIKRTYPDGKLPEGAVTPPDLVEKIV